MKSPFKKAISNATANAESPHPSFDEFLYRVVPVVKSEAADEDGQHEAVDTLDADSNPFLFLIEKARTHKYIMRIPNKRPPPKYRYIYDIKRGRKYVGDEEHLKEGNKIKVKHEDGHAHLEVLESKDGKVKVKHSETGDVTEHDMSDLTKKIQEDHKGAISHHKNKLRKRIVDTMSYGSPAQQRVAMENAASYGVYNMSMFDSEKAWGGEKGEVAQTLHDDLVGDIEVNLRDDVLKFSNPQGAKTGLRKHQAEGAQMAINSLEKRDAFMLQDETGLGKTVTALATIKESAPDRTLYVVPTTNAAQLKVQLQGDASLYDMEIKNALGEDTSKGGIYTASYEELYDTEAVLDDDGNPVMDKKGDPKRRHILRDEFKNGFDFIVFDESHSMSNPDGVRAQACVELQGLSDKIMYMSATPFTDFKDMHYMRKMGMFSDGAEFTSWAASLGASVGGGGEPPGDLTSNIGRSDDPTPLVAVAAYMTHNGMTVRRSPNLDKTLKASFQEIKSDKMRPEHSKAFEVAEQIRDIAINSGVKAFNAGAMMSIWRRQMWECVKVEDAIGHAKKAIDEGGNAALYFSFKKFDHAPLKSFAKQLSSSEGQAKFGIDPEKGKEAAASINELIATMPDFDPIEEVKAQMSKHIGADKIAEIHGAAKSDAKQEAADYQSNKKQLMISTISKGGTGLSLHDETGDRPRTQINLSLPYTAVEHQQLGGRSHRMGSMSDTNMIYLVGDHESEQRVGEVVAAKLRTMGAAVAGDAGSNPDARDLQNWEFSNSEGTHDQRVDGVAAASTDGKTDDPVAELTRSAFKDYMENLQAGGDIFHQTRQAVGRTREAKQDTKHRESAAKIHAAGFDIKSRGDVWTVDFDNKTPHGKLLNDHIRSSLKRGTQYEKPESVERRQGFYAKPEKGKGKGKQVAVIRDKQAFTELAKKLNKKNLVPDGDHGAVPGWSGEQLSDHKEGLKSVKKADSSFSTMLLGAVMSGTAVKRKKKKKVSKAADLVGRKIRKLLEEGYPYEQAIAVAIRMGKKEKLVKNRTPRREA